MGEALVEAFRDLGIVDLRRRWGPDEHDDFAAGLDVGGSTCKVAQEPAPDLLVELRQLAGDDGAPICTEDLGHVGECVGEPRRRFEEREGRRHGSHLCQARPAGRLLCRQETRE